jgi:hypothetical protein
LTEHGAFSSALLSLKQQLIDFRFDYPLEFIPNSGTRDSLSYYMYGDELSWKLLRLDSSGIAQAWYRMTGLQYWPGYIAWYGLVHLGRYLREERKSDLAIFLHQAQWLEDNATVRDDGSVVWSMNFDYPVCGVIEKAPWISAHAQGFCISALVRAWRITRKLSLYQLLERSSEVFLQDHRNGGIRVPLAQGALYTETPGGPIPGILDGFLTSLLALHDLFVETGSPQVQQLFEDGITGLKAYLPQWNYQGKWSWYGSREYLCSPAYHAVNRLLLLALSEVTRDAGLRDYALKWDIRRLSLTDRIEIYCRYNWGQVAIRVKNRSWQLHPQVSSRLRDYPRALRP